jgi:DnaJ family protein C protein 9
LVSNVTRHPKRDTNNPTDKVSADQKDTAHTKFQAIVFAYGVLSDPIRRKRYDTTGSTSESVGLDDDFNWNDFYRSQFADVVTEEAITKFSREYKNSIEEKDAVLAAYRQGKGKWDAIYEVVMLSNPLDDEERFRGIIDQGIEDGEVDAYKSYTHESKKSKDGRMKAAALEGEEAMAYAQELGVADKLFGKKGGKKGGKKDDGESGLAALIKSRQVDRGSFFDHLEAKYAVPEKKGNAKKGKKRGSEDEEEGDLPSEEAFQAAAERLKSGPDGRKSKKAKH